MTLDAENADHDDLRSSQSPWQRLAGDQRSGPVAADFACEVLIVGGGITGSLLAEHLTAQGRDVVVIDREPPGLGSTAASTAMLQWEIDAPLHELADLYGFERAAEVYQRSYRAVAGLQALARAQQVPCDFRERSTLYLAAGEVGRAELAHEHELRQRAGLPGTLLGHGELLAHFSLDREAAILSPGSADADPLCLAQGLLARARGQGARVLAGDAEEYVPHASGITVGLASGREIEARHVVLATGYAMPEIVPADIHEVASSWAIVTPPQRPGTLWRDEVLIWEASEAYAYARTTASGSIVIGGEDEEIVDPEARDRLIPQKSAILQRKLAELWPQADTTVAARWAGAFGTTMDGLPLIGAVPGLPRLYAAYGYGGNGITFSYLASRLIGRLIAGRPEPWFDAFALDRPEP